MTSTTSKHLLQSVPTANKNVLQVTNTSSSLVY